MLEYLKQELESKFGILYQEGESYICYGEKLGVSFPHTIKINPGIKISYITHVKIIDDYLLLFANGDLTRPIIEIDLIKTPTENITLS